MLGWVFSCKEGDLDNRDVERVGLLVASDFERSPDSVIETTAHGVGPDSCSGESINDFLGYFLGASVGVGFFIVICWEAVETVRVLTPFAFV
jgi:hypothetical protein